MSYRHTPVLLKEALEYLEPMPGQNFIDGTLGGGGYTNELLRKSAPDGRILAIDLDKKAIDNFAGQIKGTKDEQRVILVHGNFARLDKLTENAYIHHQFNNIAGIVVDIGLSSFQLDNSDRGISFQKDEVLDMRFDESSKGSDARFIINNYTDAELTGLFRNYSEERNAGRIAKFIVKARTDKPIQRTTELVEVIKAALPKPVAYKWADSARRVFQSLRIAVNHELENLQEFLPKALDLLIPNGRLVVVSFHSLEDRIVKQFFLEAAKGCVCPPDFPYCQCGKDPVGKILTRKVVTAGTAELAQNSRSRPAKLRALQKL